MAVPKPTTVPNSVRISSSAAIIRGMRNRSNMRKAGCRRSMRTIAKTNGNMISRAVYAAASSARTNRPPRNMTFGSDGRGKSSGTSAGATTPKFFKGPPFTQPELILQTECRLTDVQSKTAKPVFEGGVAAQIYPCAKGKTVQNCSHQHGHFDRDVLSPGPEVAPSLINRRSSRTTRGCALLNTKQMT